MFMWVPAHVGLKENEVVGRLVKQALQRDAIDLHVSLSKSEVSEVVWREAVEIRGSLCTVQ